MHQDTTWYGGRPRPRRLCVIWGPSCPQKRDTGPQFSVHFYCGQVAGWIKMPLGTEVGLIPGDIVLYGDRAPPKRGAASQFLDHVCCGQMARCIRIPVGTEVGLGPGDFVLDGDPAPHLKEAQPPIFSPCLLWPDSWMNQDATWYEGRPRPRRHCGRWGSNSHQKGHSPQFSDHVYCGHTAGCIKILLGTEVGLGPGDIVLDEDPALPQKGA